MSGRGRSASCSSRTGARSRCGSSARAASSGSRPSRSPSPTTPARSTHGAPARRWRSRATSTRPSTSGRRSRPAPTRSIPGTGSCPRARGSPRRSRRPGSSGSGRRRMRSASGGDKLAAKRIAREAGVPVVETGDAGDARLPAADQGGRGRRRTRDAGRALGGGARRRRSRRHGARRRRPSATTRSSSSATSSRRATSRCSSSRDSHGHGIALGERECSIQRRHQKVLEESPSPASTTELRLELGEAALRFADAIDYRGAGTAEFVGHRARVLLPRAERADPGRAPGDRGRDRPRPRRRRRSGSPRATSSTAGGLPSGHAIEVRLYAEDPRTFLPQSGRIERLRLPGVGPRRPRGRRGRHDRDALRPDDREADRARRDAGRGDREAARGARRDRGRRRHHEPAVPALARRASGVPRRRHDDRLPHALPAALARLRRRSPEPSWRGVVPRSTSRPPPVAAPPDLDDPGACPRGAARSTTRSWPRCRGR